MSKKVVKSRREILEKKEKREYNKEKIDSDVTTGLVERLWSTKRRGISSPFLLHRRIHKKRERFMKEKILSVFIDESGDFGPYDSHSPFYLVSMVLHNQRVDITKNIDELENHMRNLGYKQHAIHTGPLIRRESVYTNDDIDERRRLFHALFHFTRRLDIRYVCVKIKKRECPDVVALTSKVSGAITDLLRIYQEFWEQFDHIIVYYDNGQVELTKLLTSIFHTLYVQVEFRKVKPVNYKLFQVADLICTMELLIEKADSNAFSRSEKTFFGSVRDFRKNYL